MATRVTTYVTVDGLEGKTVRPDEEQKDELVQIDVLHSGFGLTWSTDLSADHFIDEINKTVPLTPESHFTAWFASEGKEVTLSVREILAKYKQKPRYEFWNDCFFFFLELDILAIGWETFPRFADQANPQFADLIQGPKYCSIRSGYYDPGTLQAFVRSTASKQVATQLPDLWKEADFLAERIKQGDLPFGGGGSVCV